MKIKFKRLHKDSVIPKYSHDGDACMDVTAISKTVVDEGTYGYIEYGTGLSFSVPEDHAMLCFPRSSISNKGVFLSNSVGVIDPNFTGELRARFKYIKGAADYNEGDRIFQIMVIPRPKIELVEVDELEKTERGDGGFGSTGN